MAKDLKPYRAKARVEGYCIRCLSPKAKVTPPYVQCSACRALMRSYYDRDFAHRVVNKLCTLCGKSKPLKGYKWCAACRIRRAYIKGDAHRQRCAQRGITTKDFKRMLDKQHSKCAICGVEHGLKLCVDHSHSTGKIRGLLCQNCNKSLGLMKDNAESFRNAAKYLRKFQKDT